MERIREEDGIYPVVKFLVLSATRVEKRSWNATDRVVINLSGRGDRDLSTYMLNLEQ